jgi:hypothetical protein
MSNDREFVEDFGPYKLVAREVEGKHYGILWRTETNSPAVKLIQITANSTDEAKAMVEASFYQSRLDQVSQSEAAAANQQQIVRAWMYIWPHLNPNQKLMITAQYHAPDRQMTTTQLANIVKWEGHSGVNLWYGYAGFMMFGECPRELPIDEKSGKPVFSFALSNGWYEDTTDGKRWVWEMRPEIAEGLKLAGLIAVNR